MDPLPIHSAQMRVFLIPELLNLIASHVTTNADLVSCVGVSQAWNSLWNRFVWASIHRLKRPAHFGRNGPFAQRLTLTLNLNKERSYWDDLRANCIALENLQLTLLGLDSFLEVLHDDTFAQSRAESPSLLEDLGDGPEDGPRLERRPLQDALLSNTLVKLSLVIHSRTWAGIIPWMTRAREDRGCLESLRELDLFSASGWTEDRISTTQLRAFLNAFQDLTDLTMAMISVHDDGESHSCNADGITTHRDSQSIFQEKQARTSSLKRLSCRGMDLKLILSGLESTTPVLESVTWMGYFRTKVDRNWAFYATVFDRLTHLRLDEQLENQDLIQLAQATQGSDRFKSLSLACITHTNMEGFKILLTTCERLQSLECSRSTFTGWNLFDQDWDSLWSCRRTLRRLSLSSIKLQTLEANVRFRQVLEKMTHLVDLCLEGGRFAINSLLAQRRFPLDLEGTDILASDMQALVPLTDELKEFQGHVYGALERVEIKLWTEKWSVHNARRLLKALPRVKVLKVGAFSRTFEDGEAMVWMEKQRVERGLVMDQIRGVEIDSD